MAQNITNTQYIFSIHLRNTFTQYKHSAQFFNMAFHRLLIMDDKILIYKNLRYIYKNAIP